MAFEGSKGTSAAVLSRTARKPRTGFPTIGDVSGSPPPASASFRQCARRGRHRLRTAAPSGPHEAVAVLVVMHVAIALVTCNALVHVAPICQGRKRPRSAISDE